MTASSSEKPHSGTLEVDSKSILVEVVGHMKRQNEHQTSQLERGEIILSQLRSTNRRVNVLVAAAVLGLGLSWLHEQKIDRIATEQQAAQARSVSLEKAVDQKIATGTDNVVKKVEELGNTAPKVVTDSNGTLSLSFPVTAGTADPMTSATVAAVSPKPVPHVVRASAPSAGVSKKPLNVLHAEGSADRVLLPLE